MNFTIFHDLLNQRFVLQVTIPDDENNYLPSWLRTPPNSPDILDQLRYLTAVATFLTNLTEEDLQMDLIGIKDIDESEDELPDEEIEELETDEEDDNVDDNDDEAQLEVDEDFEEPEPADTVDELTSDLENLADEPDAKKPWDD